jgi:hypothetical protein
MTRNRVEAPQKKSMPDFAASNDEQSFGENVKEVVVAYSEQVLQYLPEGTEETRKAWARRLSVSAEFRNRDVPNEAAPVHLRALNFVWLSLFRPAG